MIGVWTFLAAMVAWLGVGFFARGSLPASYGWILAALSIVFTVACLVGAATAFDQALQFRCAIAASAFGSAALRLILVARASA